MQYRPNHDNDDYDDEENNWKRRKCLNTKGQTGTTYLRWVNMITLTLTAE